MKITRQNSADNKNLVKNDGLADSDGYNNGKVGAFAAKNNYFKIWLIIVSALCALLIAAVITLTAVTVNLYNRENVEVPPKDFNSETLLYSMAEVRGSSAGSGVLIKIGDVPYIITNEHVISGGAPTAKFYGTFSFIDCTLIGYDAYHDIALIKPSSVPGGAKFAAADDSGLVSIGGDVWAAGNGFGEGLTLLDGIISSRSKMFYQSRGNKSVPVYQVSAPINEGMSGGGLFDRGGKLIGINTYQARSDNNKYVDGVSYSVPMSIAYPLVKQIANQYDGSIVSTEKINKIVMQNIGDSTSLIDFTDLKFTARYTNDGLTVATCLPNPAVTGGELKVGDIIESIGNLKIDNFTGYPPLYAQLLKYNKSNDSNYERLKIQIKRNGNPMTLTFVDYRLKNY